MKFDSLVQQIRAIDEHARRDTARAVNVGLTLRNWAIGFYIGHYELKGEDRSKECGLAIGGNFTAIVPFVAPIRRFWGR